MRSNQLSYAPGGGQIIVEAIGSGKLPARMLPVARLWRRQHIPWIDAQLLGIVVRTSKCKCAPLA